MIALGGMRMLHAGVDRVVLRAQMGHCSEEMTERYAGVSADAKREAVARIEKRADGILMESPDGDKPTE